MSLDVFPAPPDQLAPRRRGRGASRTSRTERRRLSRLDALSARLAELESIRRLAEEAASVVDRGWVQGGWFRVADVGGTRVLSAYDVDAAGRQPVVGACLVGGVVQAGGGPAAVHSQLVQRGLDLTWHTLRESPGEPVRWNPGPVVRALHVRDLTRWNDAARRTQGEVVALLTATARRAEVERERTHAEVAALA